MWISKIYISGVKNTTFFKEFHGHGAAVGRDFCVHSESITKREKASPNARGLSCGHCQLTFEIRSAIVQELECRH